MPFTPNSTFQPSSPILLQVVQLDNHCIEVQHLQDLFPDGLDRETNFDQLLVGKDLSAFRMEKFCFEISLENYLID